MRPARTTLVAAVGLAASVLARDAAPQPAPASAPSAASAAPASTALAAPAGAPLEARPIAEATAKLVDEVKSWGGRAGVLVVDLQSGVTLASADEHGSFNPASNAKLPTAAAALHILGPDHRFLTGLYGRIKGDAVDELVLRGQGDPSLRTENLWTMARNLRDAGVRRVGTIQVDQSYFDDRFAPPAYESQPQEWAPFRAPVAAVSVDENTVTFIVRATQKSGKDAAVRVEPPGFVDVAGKVGTSDKDEPEALDLALEPRGARLAAKIGGTVPEGARLMRVVRRVDDPRLLAGYALRALLDGAGVEVGPEVRLGGDKQKTLLVAHRSAPLGELVGALGKDSDNFYAESLFKVLGAERKGRPGTADAGAAVVDGFLRDIGASEAGVVVKNGSGLFDANRTTPSALVALLRSAWQSPRYGAEFVGSLAVGGVDGTLKSRLRSFAGSRAVRAKTGTLDAVTALSGYVLRPGGAPPIAFAVLVEKSSGKVARARARTDELVEAIAGQLHRKGR